MHTFVQYGEKGSQSVLHRWRKYIRARLYAPENHDTTLLQFTPAGQEFVFDTSFHSTGFLNNRLSGTKQLAAIRPMQSV